MEHDPTVVVWVGNATKLKGMSLLSRIMDEGSPIMLQDSYLCRQFHPGKLLMAGTGSLAREFRAIQPEHLMDAIDEALWILVTYNNLSISFIRNAIRLLIQNLPVVDLAHYREHTPLYWQVRAGVYGNPALAPAVEDNLVDTVNMTFSAEARGSVGLDDRDQLVGFCSDLFRRTIYAPDPATSRFAPAVVTTVDWRVAAILGALQAPQVYAQDGVGFRQARFDPAAPPVTNNFMALSRHHLDGVMLCFSGRAGYVIYAYTQPVPQGNNPADIVDGGWVLEAAVPPLVGALANVPGRHPGGQWVRWAGGNDANGLPHTMTIGLQVYAVYHAVPTTEDGYMGDYTPPVARLRRFDVPADFRLANRANFELPDIIGAAPRVGAYINDNVRPGSVLEFVYEGEVRRGANMSMTQRNIMLMVGLSYCWDAAHGAAAQNDAYRRWMDAVHAQAIVTTIPDELKVYLGGVRCRKYLEACGGLWTLCFTPQVSVVSANAGHEPVLEFLRRPDTLASYILKLRCAVEMSDQMCRVSNARLIGCQLGFLRPEVVDQRIEDAGIDQLTVVDTGKYIARQACILASVFDHPDSAVARSFGVEAVSTMRLREVGALDNNFTLSAVQHMNWLTPQVLSCSTWMCYYGVAAPSFVPDRVARGWMREAKFSTKWQDVSDHLLPGGLIDRDDEIWCAVFSGMVYHDWYPATLAIAHYGRELVVDVSRVRTKVSSRYTTVPMRLNLPYETRFGTVSVRGVNLNAMRRAILPCDGQSQWREGDLLRHSAVHYSPEGLVQGVALEAAVPEHVDVSNVDLRNTTLASQGIAFGRFRPNLVVMNYPVVQRCSGQFWLKTVAVDEAISAGVSAGAQWLLTHLGPPAEIVPEDDGGADVVLARQQLLVDAPNVAIQAASTPQNDIGNEPLHEVLWFVSILNNLN